MVTYFKRYDSKIISWIPIQKVEFLSMCKHIGIVGGYKRSTFEILERAALAGNEKAIKLYNNIKRVES